MTQPSKLRAPGVRYFGRFNWRGLWTLYTKEVYRFIKISGQTVVAPIINTLIFLAIFSLALGAARPTVGGVAFSVFIAPGLIMMSVMQNAFANSASSLLISKVQGNIVDVLMPPLSPTELNIAFALGGATRGITVAIAAALAMALFLPVTITHLWAVVFFGVSGALMLSLFGIIGGIWSEKFEHLQAVSNFVIIPLSFLSGTFYSLKQLPHSVWIFAQYNPFFFLIDGFRYGLTGYGESSLLVAVITVTAINIILWMVCQWLFKIGFHLKT